MKMREEQQQKQDLNLTERKSHLTDPERDTQNNEALFPMKQIFFKYLF